MIASNPKDGEWGVTDNWYKIYFQGDENILELESGHVAQLCEYTENLQSVITCYSNLN